MSKQLDDYSIETVESNGTYLKLQKNQEESFKYEDFQTLQMNMIQSNHIPRLLPMTFENMNNWITVFYKIEGLRPLRPLTKEHPPTMQEYYAFFINLIQALQDSENNMLTEQHFILSEEYIYIGNGYHDVYLTYLPLKEVDEHGSIYEDLKKLMLNLASEVQGLNGSQFKMILNYIKDPGFSLQGIKRVLSQLQDRQEEETEEDQQQDSQKQETMYKTKKVRRLPSLEKKPKLYSILAGIVLLAVIWKVYDEFTNAIMLTLTSIVSLAVVSGVFVYWFVWRPGVDPIITEKHVKVKSAPTSSKAGHKENKPAASKSQEAHETPDTTSADTNKIQAEDGLDLHGKESASTLEQTEITDNAIIGQSFEPLHDETMLLDESEMTNEMNRSSAQNYLLVDREDKEERIDLDTDNFVIGRTEKGTHLVETGSGISRMHVEFIKLSDTYGVKDLGSKNGTYVNQEKIIPYKIHELSDEDTVQIGKTIFTYRISYD